MTCNDRCEEGNVHPQMVPEEQIFFFFSVMCACAACEVKKQNEITTTTK